MAPSRSLSGQPKEDNDGHTPRHQLTGRSGWTLMTAIHDALRRDLDELVHTTASRTAARAHGAAFRDQLDFHLAAEDSACWPPARARLTGDPHGQALLDAMEDDEQQLIGPLRAVTDDAFTMDADPRRLRQLLARLRTRLTSSLALRRPARCRSSPGSSCHPPGRRTLRSGAGRAGRSSGP